MHTDEAVHALKFKALYEQNDYRYDPVEYHGPTLNYFTLVSAWLGSADSFAEMSESTFRIVPVFFGLVLVLVPVFFGKGLGRSFILISAFLTAIAPAMVFYSRYYIQEMLLVCFTMALLVAGYRFLQQPRIGWALAIGLSAGLMHATKETCVIAFAAMTLALVITTFWSGSDKAFLRSIRLTIKARHIIVMIAAAFFISALFHSSFGSHPRGILDSILTYKIYLLRGAGDSTHVHPWYYYFQLLLFNTGPKTPLWTEAIVVFFAGVALVQIMGKKNGSAPALPLQRFIAIYTFFMTLIYSLLPYKTPWSLLSFYHGMILLAAIGMIDLLSGLRRRILKIPVIALLILGCSHLIWQSWQLNDRYCAAPTNPYVYAHPGSDVPELAQHMDAIAQIHPNRYAMVIQVIYPDHGYWPLPWYLRQFTRIGWWDQVNRSVLGADVILTAADAEPLLAQFLYEAPAPGERHLYVPLFEKYVALRPNAELRGFMKKELWDLWQQKKLERRSQFQKPMQ